MKINKIIISVWVIWLLSALLAMKECNAKNIQPGDIMGRDLNYPGLGWLGHVGMATGDNMNQADWVIEVANQYPCIRFVTLPQFKNASKYWGSRFGVSHYDVHTKHALIAAKFQSWWAPKYTMTSTYKVGSGDLNTGWVHEAGEWRCDTFAWWIFADFGMDVLGGRIITPSAVFNGFPFGNNQLIEEPIKPPLLINSDLQLDQLTTDEINALTIEDFLMIADVPTIETTPTHIAAEWRLMNDPNLHDAQKGAFLDRISSLEGQQDVVIKLIKMYNETDPILHPFVKEKILSAMQDHHMRHMDLNEESNDKLLLKAFYYDLLSKKHRQNDAYFVLDGFLRTSTAQEIIANLFHVNRLLDDAEAHSSMSLHIHLIHLSLELERIYMPLLIKRLTLENDSDIDNQFFSILYYSYESYKTLDSKRRIKGYLEYRKDKYTVKHLHDPKDPLRKLAAQSYNDLLGII